MFSGGKRGGGEEGGLSGRGVTGFPWRQRAEVAKTVLPIT